MHQNRNLPTKLNPPSVGTYTWLSIALAHLLPLLHIPSRYINIYLPSTLKP